MKVLNAGDVTTAKPYKGPESYQAEDTHLFFGREREAEHLIARILSSKFSIVHAQSGAGKTSLLNARVIPGLERRGWGACRILPQSDPVVSTRAAALGYVLPHPLAELAAVERAVKSLSRDADPTLDELLARYDLLKVRDPRRRALISPVRAPVGAEPEAESPSVTPYFCRLMRSSVDTQELAEHVEAVWQQADAGTRRYPPVSGSTRASELLGLFSNEGFVNAHERLVNELKTPGRDLKTFFQQLVEVYGRRRTRFALVLVLDQFEELFTRFVDDDTSGTERATGLADWRLRREFFEQLERLYCPSLDAAKRPAGAAGDGPPLPLRYVVSMRDEFIAQMGPVRRFLSGAEECLFHLNLLGKAEAAEAIREPAMLFGYTYEAKCFGRIIGQLTKEDSFVEPAHLQLVCEKLWNEQGSELATVGDEAAPDAMPSVTLKVFERLGETKGILNSFFRDFLAGLNEREREEALEMLETLVTASGTRNIVERERLIGAPFRDRRLRGELLDRLANRTVVRTEPRLSGYFVEITHEFLIKPIMEACGQLWASQPEYRRSRLALRKLERQWGMELAGGESPLSPLEFASLHRIRESFRWDAWGSELMLRAATQHNAGGDALRVWLEEFQKHWVQPKTFATPPDDDAKPFGEGRELLSLAELRAAVTELPEDFSPTATQAALMLRSELFWATDDERQDVIHWAERMLSLAE